VSPAGPLAGVELAPGYAVCPLINGGWQLSHGHRAAASDPGALVDALLARVDQGFTTFDCADIYGGVEELLGAVVAALRARGASRGELPLQIHTKLVPDLADLPRVSPRYVEAVVDRSLARLGVERLDLVQLHWWDYGVGGYVEAADALSRLRTAGKVRLLGLTNFDAARLGEILAAGVPVSTLQVQYSLLDRRPESGVVQLCRRHGVSLLCYGTLAGGFFGLRWRGADAPPPPLANRSLVKYRLIIEEAGGWRRFQTLLETVAAVGERHGVGVAAVALRWVLDRPAVVGAVVGLAPGRSPAELLAALTVTLDADDRARLAEAIAGLAGPAGDVYGLEREPGGRHAAIMRTDLCRPEL